jgi:hypothetical protein
MEHTTTVKVAPVRALQPFQMVAVSIIGGMIRRLIMA